MQVSAAPTAEPISGVQAQKADRARRNGTIGKRIRLRVVVAAAPVAATQCRFGARIDNVTGETVGSTRTNTVETTLFEIVYDGPNHRMLLPSEFEILRFLSFSFGSAFPFAARHREFHQVGWKLEGWKDYEIRAASSQFRVPLLRIMDQPPPPSHNFLCSRMNWYWSMRTGTPSSTETSAFPF